MNYVVTQIARPKENKVPQMQSAGITSVDAAMEVYLKNAIVSLASAKLCNTDVTCILNTDFPVPKSFQEIAEKANIELHTVPFGRFKSKEEFPWAIAQYKYDSMSYVADLMGDDDCMVLLDTDTVCTQNMGEIFEEAKNFLLLYPTNHSFNQEKRRSIILNYQKLYSFPNPTNLLHYGGEFFAGNKELIKRLLSSVQEVITRALNCEGLEAWDDEHVLSIAVEQDLKKIVYSASPYIFRYWTNQFYLVSTNYYYDPVKIWHLPAEKNFGMLVLYEYFEKNLCFPDIKKMARIMGFPGARYKKWNPYRWKMRIRNKFRH